MLEFTLKGQPLTLGAFVEAGAGLNRLFVPFSDMTSGTETYPAGRYLELDRTSSGVYTIDFNKAYNPYCYYNASYRLPVSAARKPACRCPFARANVYLERAPGGIF